MTESVADDFVGQFPEDATPPYMIRDHDGIYGEHFKARVRGMSIEEIRISPRKSVAELLRRTLDR